MYVLLSSRVIRSQVSHVFELGEFLKFSILSVYRGVDLSKTRPLLDLDHFSEFSGSLIFAVDAEAWFNRLGSVLRLGARKSTTQIFAHLR